VGDVRATRPPSGEQFEIEAGAQRAVVTEVGGSLRAYVVDGADVVDGFAEHESSTAGRGQILAPWPNRLADGRYEFEGVAGRASLDEPDRGNAIHGLVRWLRWAPTARTRSSVTLACTLSPQPAYPWWLELSIEYALGDDGLTVTVVSSNRSETPAPFGIGFHPYVTVGTPSIDQALVRIPARRRLVADDRGLPTGETDVADTDFDLRSARVLGDTELDTCFTDLERTDDDRVSVDLAAPAESRLVSIWADRVFGYLMVYTGHTLDPVERRRQGLAIEPMTCPPNAFQSGRDVVRLDPDSRWTGSWGIHSPS
jgi:aldose 1-epimerase